MRRMILGLLLLLLVVSSANAAEVTLANGPKGLKTTLRLISQRLFYESKGIVAAEVGLFPLCAQDKMADAFALDTSIILLPNNPTGPYIKAAFLQSALDDKKRAVQWSDVRPFVKCGTPTECETMASTVCGFMDDAAELAKIRYAPDLCGFSCTMPQPGIRPAFAVSGCAP